MVARSRSGARPVMGDDEGDSMVHTAASAPSSARGGGGSGSGDAILTTATTTMTARSSSSGGGGGGDRPAAVTEPTSHASKGGQDPMTSYGVDMRRALVPQVAGMTRADYLVWVHTPVSLDGADARLFPWDGLEALSMTVWWAVPAVWLPLAAVLLFSYAGTVESASVTAGSAGMAAGVLLWTLLEYTIHRFLFHADAWVPDSGPALVLHFLLHGLHHKVPMDRYRLVLPPAMFAILAAPAAAAVVAGVSRGVLPTGVALTVSAGVLAGYVAYDLTHYALHHINSRTSAGFCRRLKSTHLAHHFADDGPTGAFGITSPLWDIVFHTQLAHRRRA